MLAVPVALISLCKAGDSWLGLRYMCVTTLFFGWLLTLCKILVFILKNTKCPFQSKETVLCSSVGAQ